MQQYMFIATLMFSKHLENISTIRLIYAHISRPRDWRDVEIKSYISDIRGTWLLSIWFWHIYISVCEHYRLHRKYTEINSWHLTHWGRVTHITICVSELTTIGSDNGMSPDRRQAIIWTNVGILWIRSLETKFRKYNRNVYMLAPENAFENVVRWPLCFGLNVLMSRQSFVFLLIKSKLYSLKES